MDLDVRSFGFEIYVIMILKGRMRMCGIGLVFKLKLELVMFQVVGLLKSPSSSSRGLRKG